MHLLLFLVFGFVVGLIARAITPGTQRMGCLTTTLTGAAGSFVGGLLGNMISGDPWGRVHAAGWIGSILGAVIVMLILRRTSR